MVRRMRRCAVLSAAMAAAAVCSGCGALQQSRTGRDGSVETVAEESLITVGFAQVGEESDWRRANSVSVEEAFSMKNGYRLLFDDAQNDQENQITAIRNFIQQDVDYIVLEPIVENGWDTVLGEAKSAGIPVVAADRRLVVGDDSLYRAWVGSDSLKEGRRICAWIHAWCGAAGVDEKSLRIVNIQGTIGSTPQIGRDQALQEAVEAYGWTLLAQTKGEFTQAKGREAMEDMLQAYPDLNVVYCDNDNEAYGAIDALEKAGKVPGTDLENGEIMVVSFDGAKKALSYVRDGKIAADAECNPMHGPRIRAIVETLEAGETVAREQYVDESLYAVDSPVKEVTAGGEICEVLPVTKELIDGRLY